MSINAAYEAGVQAALEKMSEFQSAGQSAGRARGDQFKTTFTKSISAPKNKLVTRNTAKHLNPQDAARNYSIKSPAAPRPGAAIR